ncbi:uncharacterized protein BT62DRAFT_994956 [Guyanagaster necrorhizus]|uniref:Uncharacterized protein n=1 Tax=Guyanagaster necrorhizus TaxID=856835 RepID=A0A9P8AR15_9AGAR|nr:uncharacterized protein BT62DRAFT_994956 [Guyanagaster necrorhizus MCA 3950]KAG7444933.1 hypothetical protein BT62DRAFT_994956 [Guyanagaster necrorhizus MCA 3950]
MASYNYVDPTNSNLVCCICRTPFLDPVSTLTCGHTFCRACIVEALQHSSQCPVDRLPLTLEEVVSANSIVRSLVDELVVECPSPECPHTCQRQLLAGHLRDSCSYAEVPCPTGECDQLIPRKDMESHRCGHTLITCHECGTQLSSEDFKDHEAECLPVSLVCDFCSAEYSRDLQSSHAETCSEAIISCVHASNGCSWKGKRRSFTPKHIPSCPYEAIKGFLSLHESKMADLREENLGLRNKIDALQGHLQNATRDLHAAKTALGPWYTQSLAHSIVERSPHVQQRVTSSTPHVTESTVSSPAPSTSADTPDIFAPYFPEDESFSAQASPEQLSSFSWRPLHGTSSNISQAWDPASLTSRPVAQNNIAPLDLSTTLEGSLSGLRQSVVSLSASMDSFGRRNEIALTNEALRVNEEIRSLRANIHGLRMQVHAIMMDRNAQVTGRMQEMPSVDGPWTASSRFIPGGPPVPSITKL